MLASHAPAGSLAKSPSRSCSARVALGTIATIRFTSADGATLAEAGAGKVGAATAQPCRQSTNILQIFLTVRCVPTPSEITQTV
jgi:hypothetical protein